MRRILAWSLFALAVLAPADVLAQQRQVTGRVTVAGTAEPVGGVAVTVVGQTGAATTVTDAEGRYSISVPAGEVRLEFRTFGYTNTQVVVPAGQSTVNVELQRDVFRLDELVVTGQATSIERRNATTAISYVSGDELNKVSSPTVLTALNGKITGVNLQTNSGAPGGGIQMQIRGNNTILGGFDPLFVVDGVIYSNASIPSGRGFANNAASASTEADAVNRIADLNPADIASIEVLKGAAASSIYGSKAANGVVVITTVRGQAGAPRINVTQRLGVSTPLRLLDSRVWPEDSAIARFGEAVRPFFTGGTPNFDLYEQVFSNRSLSYETTADVSGGSLDTRYYVSGTWNREEGIERNTGAGRQSLRVNIDQVLGSRFDVKVSSVFNRAENDRGWNNNCNNYGCHGYALAYIPSFINLEQRGPDGNYVNPNVVGIPSNPIQLTELGRNHEETNRFTGGLTLSWDAFGNDRQSLQVIGGAGIDGFDQQNDVWTPNDLYFEQVSAQPGESIESGGRSLFYNWNMNGIHTLNGAGWSATTSFGMQYENRRLSTWRIRAQNLLPGERNVNQGTNITAVENLQEERTFALYAQEGLFLLDERLLLQAGLRAERSSVNGDIDKYYVFPKVSGSYRFLDLLGDGSEIKLRAAYGETGNQPIFGQKFTNLGTPQLGGEQGITVATASGSPDVEPERLKEVEGGIDGSALNGRLTWELTGFNRNTTNLLLQRVPAPSSGFTTQVFNGGKLRNSGVEIALGYTPILTADVQWIARGTFTRYTSEVEDLAGLPAFYPPQSGFGNLGRTRIEEGQPITQIVGFKLLENGTRDSVISQLGNTAPDFRVGFVNDFTYKAATLSFVLDWQQGGDVIDLTTFLYDDGRNSADWGTPDWQRRYQGYLAGAIEPYIKDASFLKVREVALNFDVPQQYFASVVPGARSLRVGLTGRNLFMWTKYDGLDPEVANFGPAAIRNNLDISPYPPSRTFFFNVSVGF